MKTIKEIRDRFEKEMLKASRDDGGAWIYVSLEDLWALNDAVAMLEEVEETKTVVCQRCGDEIEVKWDLLRLPDMVAIAKRDAFLEKRPKLKIKRGDLK